jgi:hypothetical protein
MSPVVSCSRVYLCVLQRRITAGASDDTEPGTR